jgi:phosphate starvation-inducible PhoH-like protein
MYFFTVALFFSKSLSYNQRMVSSYSKKVQFYMKKETLKEEKLTFLYQAKTENQRKYVAALNNKNDSITAVIGPAGTGKTLLACNAAIQNLKDGKIDKIIITRPVVPVEEEIGFLPGTIMKKMDPWTRPIIDIFEEYYSKSQVTNMMLNGQIEISPLGFMRGRTFKHAFIIADEMQNSSPNQMYMLLTRIGTNSRMVITGDLDQSDKFENNGLKDFIKKYNAIQSQKSYKNINLVHLDNNDIQRSELVSQIIEMYSPIKKVDNTQINIKSNIKLAINGDNDAALMPINHLTRTLYKK